MAMETYQKKNIKEKDFSAEDNKYLIKAKAAYFEE